MGEWQNTEENIADMATRMEEWRQNSICLTNDWRPRSMLPSRVWRRCSNNSWHPDHPSIAPPVSPRDPYPTVNVMLPILADKPWSKLKENEVTNPKLNPDVGGRAPQSVVEVGCVEERTLQQGTQWSSGLDTAANGVGPSLAIGPEQPEQVS